MQSPVTIGTDQSQEAYRERIVREFAQWQHAHLKTALQQLGADRYDLSLPETRLLPLVLKPAEQIQGIVYGRYRYSKPDGTVASRGALVATNQRVLLLDRKPFFVHCDEIAYRVVSGTTYGRISLAETVTLHTRIGDISLQTFNRHCARGFSEAIEAKLFSAGEGRAP
jgi:hypothetical protein